MLYLNPGEQISVEAIAQSFDSRAVVDPQLDGSFSVSVFGGRLGYISQVPDGWRISLTSGSRCVEGLFKEVVWDLEFDGQVLGVAHEDMSPSIMIENQFVWDLVAES